MKHKTRKSEQLPKYDTFIRSWLVEKVQKLPGYQEAIEKGFPLFTSEELSKIEKKYENGSTWDEIDEELTKKGIIFKKATFRKHIQEGNLPEAMGYRNIKKSRVAIFPPKTIAHINFIQFFYKVISKETANEILKFVQNYEVPYSDAIEYLYGDTPFSGIISHMIYLDDEGIDAIRDTLINKPADRDEILQTIKEITHEYENIIAPKISNLIDLLESKTLSFSEIMTEGKNVYWKRKRLEFLERQRQFDEITRSFWERLKRERLANADTSLTKNDAKEKNNDKN